ncbi:protein FAM204A [Erpetoichthys calabaricus]|uniref:protein FAM204A n=1 Tax=Erpetoichthys calabaricus TaxID=27687 RepID=UPI002234E2D3|nr:protein FAM204A [Erpetoichthys calabaricus]
MYSGLLPPGLEASESDLSSEEAAEESAGAEGEGKAVADLTRTATRQDQEESGEPLDECCPRGVPLDMWQKFKELQTKKSEMSALNSVKSKRRRRNRHRKEIEACPEVQNQTPDNSKYQADCETHWNELQQYFGVNDRFENLASSKSLHETCLEKNIEKAIAEGDTVKAEELSDRLATRELGVKIAKAADCRDFVKERQEAEESREKRKRKKQIAWGFEAKKRWETKSNMGYM